MQKMITALLLAAGLSALPAVGEERDWQQEVAHLLDFIAESDCSFIRNDKVYDAAQAAAHINRKYEHVKKRLSSAEQFIAHAATQSSMTGKKYQVICGETTMQSSTWLEDELRAFRGAR